MDSKADSALVVDKKIYDVQKIRNDFPILKLLVHGKPLVSVSYTHLTLPTSDLV